MNVSLERVANIVMIATCVLVAGAVVSRYRIGPSSPVGVPQLPFNAGEQMKDVPGVTYAQAPVTVVLYLRSTCQYCTASMPFYRILSELGVHKSGRAQLVVASPESTETIANYLQRYGVEADKLTSSDPKRPTPTLVVVDKDGKIRGVWLGRQKADAEDDIIQTLMKLSDRTRS